MAGGKKPSAMNGVRPRVVNCSSAAKVAEKSIGPSGSVQTAPLVSGVERSGCPAVNAPKNRTPAIAPGEAANASSISVNFGAPSQSTSNTPTVPKSDRSKGTESLAARSTATIGAAAAPWTGASAIAGAPSSARREMRGVIGMPAGQAARNPG